jgi:beta-glucanase (GH16 family)
LQHKSRRFSLRRRALMAGAAAAALGAGLLAPAAASAAPTATSGGFTPAFTDNFDGSAVNRGTWGLYNGGPGTRVASNAVVHNGTLTLYSRKVNGRWSGAGISTGGRELFTYGKFEFRARLQRGDGTRAVALLWPAHGWPPEIDYFEMWDGTRQKDMLTNHYSPANHMQHNFVHADFTQWHTIGLEWTPKAITYILDGKVVAVQTGHVPHQPMWMGFQTTTGAYGPGAAPNNSTPSSVAWDIDYIKAWRYHG